MGSKFVDSDTFIGRRLGKYKIRRQLGKGGMGVVYRATDTVLDRPVALKLLPSHLVEDETALRRFAREARAAARLNHPNIVTIYGMERVDDLWFIAMEYVEGESLDKLLNKRGAVAPEKAAAMVRQAAQALAAAHRKGIVHRDIKPHNFLIDSEGTVKVTDFGLARAHSETTALTGTGTLLGTPQYMSPEQWEDSNVGPQSDIYSLGVTFYALLTGQAPFQGSTPAAIMRQILQEPPPDLGRAAPYLPNRLTKIVGRMLERDPRDRYQTAEDLLRDLEIAEQSGIGAGATARPKTVGTFATSNIDMRLEEEERKYRQNRERMRLNQAQEVDAKRRTPTPSGPPVKLPPETDRRPLYVGLAIVAGLLLLGFAWWRFGGSGSFPRMFPQDQFVYLDPGTFQMGSPPNEYGRQDDESLHTVTLTEGFWIGKFEVTQAQWEAYMDSNPSIYVGPDLPVTNVTYEQVREFLRRVNWEEGADFRLPTEAEWEYAARAGSISPYFFGHDEGSLGRYAWYEANGEIRSHSVGQKAPNPWGLYDIYGNVREWCLDWAGAYESGEVVDPQGPAFGAKRIHRGGSWGVGPDQLRSADRSAQDPNVASSDLGFRLAR